MWTLSMTVGDRVELKTHELRCETSGAGERHFLCLHGLVDTLGIWKRLVPALEKRSVVTRFDQRGHGESDAPAGPYTRKALAQDAIDVLDSLAVPRATLIGHSMGGVVAMEAALQFPDRVNGLVLIGTTSQCRSRVADWYERIALAGEERGCDGLAQTIYGKESHQKIPGNAQGIAHVTRMLKSLCADPLTPHLKDIRCPVLLLVGEADPMGPKASEIIRDALPRGCATFEMIPERGHWLHLDSHEAVIDAINAWMPTQV
jgi:3-oxoadipate enol-lactonase